MPRNLTKLTITGGERIEHGALQNCTMLREVIIPATINFIGERALQDCLNLGHIYAHRENPPVAYNNNSFERINKFDCTLHVPTGSKAKYSIADGWKEFFNIVEMLGVSGISLNKTEIRLGIGNTEQLIATVTPADAGNKNVTWSSSNASVAAVSPNGAVTAISIGTATITATTHDGGKTATCTVTVTQHQTTTGAETPNAPLTRIYPNPTDGAITLEFDTPVVHNITLADMSGRILLRQTVNHQTVKLDMSNFPSGVYLLTIDDGKRQNVERIVKN